MSEQIWTPQKVTSRLEEAASTLRHLPGGGANHHNVWPKVVLDTIEACGGKGAAISLGAQPADANGPMDEAVEWLRWLTPDQIRLVWLRALNIPWKVIVPRLRCDRTTAWRKWTVAIHIIVSRLEASQENVLQHQSVRHLQQNMA